MRIAYSVPHRGFYVLRGMHSPRDIDAIVTQVRALQSRYPFVHPTMRDGSELGVRVTNWGAWGWWSDERGFRYIAKHPKHGQAWSELPPGWERYPMAYLYAACMDAHAKLPGWTPEAWSLRDGPAAWLDEVDTALVNYYAPDAALGWHTDKTEADLRSPILTMSIGASARFEIKLDGETHSIVLHSGDGCVMAGVSRNAEHRIAKLLSPADLQAEQQADLFAGAKPVEPIYNPIKNGARLSITWRRTGLARS
jgi:alkylated DNA repair protein (DNA oxidative demethylase)